MHTGPASLDLEPGAASLEDILLVVVVVVVVSELLTMLLMVSLKALKLESRCVEAVEYIERYNELLVLLFSSPGDKLGAGHDGVLW